jgi:hypothetical protein
MKTLRLMAKPLEMCSGSWCRSRGCGGRADCSQPLLYDDAMSTFTRTVLFTDTDGRARFREETIALNEGSPQARLSALLPTQGLQLRESPVGFKSEFHVSSHAQWVFILQGLMEIGLQDGSSKVFGPGQHFFSADLLPEGAVFDPAVHGHCSRQVGDLPLITVFVRA